MSTLAEHEAAHAVVAISLNHRFTAIEITETEDGDHGCVRMTGRQETTTRFMAYIYLAGMAQQAIMDDNAQSIVFGRGRGDMRDLDTYNPHSPTFFAGDAKRDESLTHFPTPLDWSKFLIEAYIKSDRIVRAHQGEIKLIAAALRAQPVIDGKRTLTYDQVKGLLS